MSLYKMLILASLILVPVATFALEQGLYCPSEIKTYQKIQEPVTGFQSMASQSPHFLSGVTFYSGKPEEQASLAPDTTLKDKMHWTFSKQDKIYISCSYNNTNIELAKALPTRISTCTVYYDPSVTGPFAALPKKIVCH